MERLPEIMEYSSVSSTLDDYRHVIPGIGDDGDVFEGYC